MINQALIEKYFSNKLSKKELIQFNSLYENNSKFKAEVDFLKNVKLVSEKEDDTQFKNQLQTFEFEFSKKHRSPFAKWLIPLAAAATIALIAFCVEFYWHTTINEDTLFANYFEPSMNVSAPIVRSESDETILNNAFMAYNEADYKKAIPLFENGFKATQNSELLFYEANAYLASGNTNKAIEKFKEHLNYTDILTQRSHWYLALAYLKNKDLKEAKNQLNKLINSGETFKKDQVSSLLKKLK